MARYLSTYEAIIDDRYVKLESRTCHADKAYLCVLKKGEERIALFISSYGAGCPEGYTIECSPALRISQRKCGEMVLPYLSQRRSKARGQ